MKDEKTISRRSFLRTMGTAGAVSAGLAACGRGGDPSAGGVEVPSGGGDGHCVEQASERQLLYCHEDV